MTDQPPNKLPELTVFFPFYNEEGNIVETVEQSLAKLKPYVDDLEMILVNDGSKDRTGELADELARRHPAVRVIHHPVNRGYGAALISGYTGATKKYVFYTDGDRQFDIDEIRLFLPHVNDYEVLTGYRIKRCDPAHRLVIAFFFNIFMRVVFKVRVRDVDCAFKLIHRKVLESFHLESQGAFIDAELLIKSGKAGYRIWETGVNHYPRTTGTPTGSNLFVLARAICEIIYNIYYFYLRR